MRNFRFVVRIAGSGAFMATTVLAPLPTFAQEGSPAAGEGVVSCATEPRDVEELVGLYFDPQGTPLATPESTTVDSDTELPSGEPVDAAVEAELNATLAELLACFDAGQYARAFALMTDDLARQTGPDVSSPDEDTPEEVRALLESQLAGTPVVDEPGMEPGAATEVTPGRDIRALEGGRVGGVWTIEGDAAFVVFEQQDDQWLIDEFIDIVEDEATMTGTPAP